MDNATSFVLPANLAPAGASPGWMNKGDNAFQLTAATLVGLQSVSGLLIQYGRAVKKKWAVNSAFMDGWVLGSCKYRLGQKFLLTFSVWSLEGFFFKMGIIDYSGGYFIHLSSGVAGFTAACWVGQRLTKDWERFPQNNILNTLGEAGLLWMGWTGPGCPVLRKILCYGRCSGDDHGSCTRMGSNNNGALLRLNPRLTMMIVHKKSELLQKVDDTMAVLHTNAVTGSLGGILVGQLLEIQFVVIINIVSTTLICLLVQLVVPPRMSEEDMEIGDDAAHGQEVTPSGVKATRLVMVSNFKL
ncbi:hypothetical protein SLEP1_g38367 [Rubroshorea leprosula]|nr:hypothetical protein SLEP1_g38367 [Rubroshorea leprosula]